MENIQANEIETIDLDALEALVKADSSETF